MTAYMTLYTIGLTILYCCAGLVIAGCAYGLVHLLWCIALGIRDTLRSYSPIKHACRGYKPGRTR